MRVAVCDDDKRITSELKPQIYEYANKKRFEMLVSDFSSGEKLLSSNLNFDIIFLDYQMAPLNGLKTAQKLREKNILSKIVFLTNYPHFVYESFHVDTFRFYEKPIAKEQLHELFDDYFKMFGNDYPVLMKCNRETVCVDTKDIVFLEAVGKHCLVHLQKGSLLDIAKTMKGMNLDLPQNHFYKVNKAFIVNFHYIEKFTSDMIYFKNGDSVHISRNYLSAFKDEYKNYSNLQKT